MMKCQLFSQKGPGKIERDVGKSSETDSNRYSETPVSCKRSRSEQKLLANANVDTPKSSTHARSLHTSCLEGYCLIDLTLLGHAIAESAVCRICNEGALGIIELKKEGMAKKLAFHCNN